MYYIRNIKRNSYVAYPFEAERPIQFESQARANQHIKYLLSFDFNIKLGFTYIIVHELQYEIYN